MITIAVLAFSDQHYRRFMEDFLFLKDDVKFVKVSHMEDVRGLRPDLVIKTYRAYELPDYYKIIDYFTK